MKKTILISPLLLSVLFFYSCSNEQSNEAIPSTDMNAPAAKSGSFEIGPYGGLGYGYDVTGEYANANSARFQVIDFTKFTKDFPQRLEESHPFSSQSSLGNEENALEFSNILSRKLDITEKQNLFGKTLSSNFSKTMTNNNEFEKKYIYSHYNILLLYNNFKVYSTLNVLQKYLTPEFLQYIDLKTPQQIVNDYGTHVMLDIYTGARMDILYQSETSNPDRKLASRVGIESAMSTVFNFPTINDDSSLDSKNFSQRLSFKTIGGAPSKSLNGYINLDQKTNHKIDIADWQHTVSFDNSYLVDFGSNGLIYIYDLVSDPTKKAALKAYVDQYLIDNEVKLN